jgi:transmembrane protein 216
MFLTITDKSSTALHLLLCINIHYTIFWFILEIVLFIFKYYHLPYAASAFGIEISMIFILCFNEFIREFFGIKGNLILQNNHLIVSIIYGIISIIGFIFFLVWQSYIQRAEILLSTIGLTLITIEILLSIITIILNHRAMPVLTKEQKIERIKQAQVRFQSSIKTD